MTTTRLYDFTHTNVIRELDIQRRGFHPLADATFSRQVNRVTTSDEREQATARLRRIRIEGEETR